MNNFRGNGFGENDESDPARDSSTNPSGTNPAGTLSQAELLHMLAERLQSSGNYLSAARHLRRVAASDVSIEAALEKAEHELFRADDAYRLLRMLLENSDAT